MDGERACQDKLTLVFAVDQRAFESQKPLSGRVNRFCVLHPLMTLAGDRLSADAESFPNPGRVWWMLRDEISEEWVVPGSIWSGTIEYARNWDAGDPESYRYQVQVRPIQPGGKDLVEILSVAEDDPDLAWVQRSRPMPWPRPTPGIVFLRGRKSVLGPLKADWDAPGQQLRLSARDIIKTEVLRIPTDVFERIARVERFSGNLNEFDNHAQVTPFSITLSKVSWLDLEDLRRAGHVLDASTDAQILNWAVKHQGLPRAQLAPMRELLASLSGDGAPADDESMVRKQARLRQIAADVGRVLDLGEENARLLSTVPAFADLVTRHVENLVTKQVAQEVQLRRHEIEAEVQPQERRLQQLKTDIDRLAVEYARRAAVEEEELRKKIATRLYGIEEREKAVAGREQRLAQQERDILQRLERVLQRYAQEAERVGDDLLVQLPLLKKLGLPGGTEPALSAAVPREVALPAFLENGKARSSAAPLDEADFLTQLTHVVEQKGFTFNAEDLINFHVCVKTGGLTILAGISGTGKSSLPRLYAEALGCRDEYLHVPVRPDWMDDRDLVGAYNAIAQRFEPANSGLVDRLIAASLDRQRERGGLYLVCLDEMNLARVEHYFAQFLSQLEVPPEERYLELFAPGLVHASDPYHPYQRLLLGENLRFLGTVNIDETTHFFSPKVLDRSQIVVLEKPTLAAPRRVPRPGPVPGLKPVSLANYLQWQRKAANDSAGRTLLLRINDILGKSRLGLGYRQFHRILDYVASARPFFSEDKALDFQLLQVVLPRLRPTAVAFPETLQALRAETDRTRFPRSAEHLARIEARVEDDFFQSL